jgi:glutaredoxin-related protein
VRRDSNGHRLPVVFIAGEVIGGRAELMNLQNSGELKKKVFGA